MNAKEKLQYAKWLMKIRRMSTIELLDEYLECDSDYHGAVWNVELKYRKYLFSMRLLRLRIEALERRKR